MGGCKAKRVEPTPHGYSVQASVQVERPELCKLVHPRESMLYNRCRSNGAIGLFGESSFLKQEVCMRYKKSMETRSTMLLRS